MDSYSPGPMTHRKAPRPSPALLALLGHGLEKTHSRVSDLIDDTRPFYQHRDQPKSSCLQRTSFSSSYETACKIEDAINRLLSNVNMNNPGPLPDDLRDHWADTMRARMDSDTLPFTADTGSRNSSVYSTDSAFSTETTGTTISDIVEMYRNVTLKKPGDESSTVAASGTQVHAPQAYRDTLVPLLQHRFRFDFEESTPETPSVFPEHKSQKAINTNYIQESSHLNKRTLNAAPSFVDFSQRLRYRTDKRDSPTQPVSCSYKTHQRYDSGVAGMTRTSLEQKRVEESGRTSDEIRIHATDRDWRNDAEIIPRPLNVTRREPHAKQSHPSTPMQSRRQNKTHIATNDATQTPNIQPPSPTRGRQFEARELYEARYPDSRTVHDQFYQRSYSKDRSTGIPDSRPEQDHLRRSASVSSKRSRLQKRDTRSSEEKADYARAASIKRSASARRPDHTTSLSGSRRNSMKASMSDMARRLSMKSHGGDHDDDVPPLPKQPQPQSRQPIQHPATPLTHYQIHGPRAFEEEIKQEIKEERRRAKEELKLEKARRSMEKKEFTHNNHSSHQRTASGKSTSSIGSMFDGWRHSLTRSASERRRERLKASIILVGLTTLTAEHNASASAGGERGGMI